MRTRWRTHVRTARLRILSYFSIVCPFANSECLRISVFASSLHRARARARSISRITAASGRVLQFNNERALVRTKGERHNWETCRRHVPVCSLWFLRLEKLRSGRAASFPRDGGSREGEGRGGGKGLQINGINEGEGNKLHNASRNACGLVAKLKSRRAILGKND
jgi:hypothetical protein